jgi:tRNA A37 N6-isopentenylltransferase MiaA
MKSMLEREREFTPVTASIVDRHVLARGSQEKVIENIQQNTRHYAKRQMTWFKRDPAVTWFKAGSIEPKQFLL